MVEGVQRGLEGAGHNPHWPWGEVEAERHPLQGVEGVLPPQLQTQKERELLGVGQVAPACPALAVAAGLWQTGCWVCSVMTAWPSCALPAAALLASRAAHLCCPSCKRMTL